MENKNSEKVESVDLMLKSAWLAVSKMYSELAQDQGLQDIKATLKVSWINAAEAALANNTVSFAYLPMEELLKPDGYLAALAAKGYTVETAE